MTPAASTPSFRAIWALAWPSMAVFLLMSIGNLACMWLAVPWGEQAVAAVTTGQRVYFCFQALMMGLTTGATVLVARAWGAGDAEAASRLATTSLWAGGALALASTVLIWLVAPPLVGLFQLPEEGDRWSIELVRLLALFYLPLGLQMVFTASLRAAGDARTPLVLGLLTALLMVPMAWLMLQPFGVPGISVGMGVAYLLVAVYMLWRWRRGGFLLRPAAPAQGQARVLLRVGTPAAIEQAVMQVGMLGFLWIVGHYGTAAYAAYGVGLQLLTLTMVVGFGFSVAGSVMVGQRLGAGDPAGAMRTGWHAMRLSAGVMVVLGAITALLAEPFARAMSHNAEVIEHTVFFIYLFALAMPLLGIDFALGGALRGAGDTRYPLLVSLVGLVVVRLGLALLAWKLGLPVEWIYATLVADYLAKNVLQVARFRSGRWAKVKL